MQTFLERYTDRISGSLSFFDRLLFRGLFQVMSNVKGMGWWLNENHILLKEFSSFVEGQSAKILEHSKIIADEARRPWEFLPSPKVSKEKLAEEMVRRDHIEEGLVCVLRAVEPCMSYTVRRVRERQCLELVRGERKCLFLYFYYVDREFGLMHVRLQTWFPFDIQVCINGREWLARRLDRAGIGYERRDNCFAAIQDPARAQKIADELIDTNWASILKKFARRANPLFSGILKPASYYWTIRQGEYATDIMFKDSAALAEIYPRFVQHAITTFSAEHVMRFLGQKLDGRFKGQLTSQMNRRPEGVCIRHSVYENSIKMYDKQGCVLRIETTINNPGRFKAYRARRDGKKAWQAMRKGIADIRRRVEISRAANGRYLESLANLPDMKPAHQVLDPVSKPVITPSQRYRPLRPVAPDDAGIFAGVMRGEFVLSGFRNADIRSLIFPSESDDPTEARRRSGRTSRLLRILRAHGLIKKLPRTSRYLVTGSGRRIMSTALTLREANAERFLKTG